MLAVCISALTAKFTDMQIGTLHTDSLAPASIWKWGLDQCPARHVFIGQLGGRRQGIWCTNHEGCGSRIWWPIYASVNRVSIGLGNGLMPRKWQFIQTSVKFESKCSFKENGRYFHSLIGRHLATTGFVQWHLKNGGNIPTSHMSTEGIATESFPNLYLDQAITNGWCQPIGDRHQDIRCTSHEVCGSRVT